MKRPAALAGLLVVSVAAGAWLFLAEPSPEPAPEPAASCEDSGSCTADQAAAREAKAETSEPGNALREPEETGIAAGRPVESARPAPTPPAAAPVDAAKLREQADELRAEGRIPDAIVALRAATRADPSARNHGDLGEMLAGVLAMDEALIHLRKAADLDPGNADRWITLANAYYRKMDPGKAWAAEKRAKQADPGLELGFDSGGRRVRKSDATGDSPAQKQ